MLNNLLAEWNMNGKLSFQDWRAQVRVHFPLTIQVDGDNGNIHAQRSLDLPADKFEQILGVFADQKQEYLCIVQPFP